jgi:hypothetical protein
VLEAMFILLEFPSPSRRFFICSHLLPPALVRRIGPSYTDALVPPVLTIRRRDSLNLILFAPPPLAMRRQSSRHSSSSSSHVGQADVTRPQSRQSHLPHWPGPDVGHEDVILSRSRHHVRGELQQRSSHRESSRLPIPSYPEDHEPRLSKSISVTSVTCRGRRFDG